jgi:ABC-type branched-subunit amino acid transport system substrate-binding protein
MQGKQSLKNRRLRPAVVALCAMGLLLSACGSRLTAAQTKEAIGAGSLTGTQRSSNSTTQTTVGGGQVSAIGTTTTTSAGSSTGSPSGGTSSGGSTPVASNPGAGAPTPAGGNGGATDIGVTATQITIANIASITGVVPGLTQSAQQATEAFAAYVNSQGGIYGRMLKVEPFDDGNLSGQNYADAEQACSTAFAMVGNASGFDDGSAQAVASCGIPTMAAEVSTVPAGNTADIYGASPGLAHYFNVGPADYLKSKYGSDVTKAAMIYLNVPATQDNALHEIQAYSTVGFDYIYQAGVTPTEANYAPYVLQMQQKGVEYVTEYSDDDSAERLLSAMQQQNFAPPIVDWFSEEYTPGFITATAPASNGNLVLMTATAAYEEASSNPGMQLFLTWMNRVAPGFSHDIFAILAWSAGLAFLEAAKAVGPDLTRAKLLAQFAQIHNWTGDGVTPPVNIGAKIPSACFFYMQIENGGFHRVYPTTPGAYDCSGAFVHY